jgi:hypothetical protein
VVVLLPTGSLLGLLFKPEDGSSAFLQGTGELLPCDIMSLDSTVYSNTGQNLNYNIWRGIQTLNFKLFINIEE